MGSGTEQGLKMTHVAYWRYAVPIVLLAILSGLYLWMHPLSQRLLTPPPGGFVAVTMVTVMPVALIAGYMLSKDIPSRLLQRLTLIAVMALSIYAGGENARGLYALSAFNGQKTVAREPWMTLGGRGDTMTLTSLRRRRSISVPASPDAVAAARAGRCVSIAVERSASGAERVAGSQPAIQTMDIYSC
jgi:hypothetical protein